MMNSNNYLAVNTASVGFAHIKINTDPAGSPLDITFLQVNPAFENVFGKETGYFTGKKASELTQEKEKLEEIIESSTALLDGVELNFDQYYEKNTKWIRVRLIPREDETFFAWITDVTAEHVLLQNSSDIIFSKKITPDEIVHRFSEITRSPFSAFCTFSSEPEKEKNIYFYYKETNDKKLYESLQAVFQDLTFDFDSFKFKEGPIAFETCKTCLGNETAVKRLEEILRTYQMHTLYFFPIISPGSLEGIFSCLHDQKKGKGNLKMAKTLSEQIGMVLFVEKQATKERRIEEELRKNKQLYQVITENISDGVALFRNDVFEYVSPSYSKMLGYSLNELTGITEEQFFTMVHPDDRQKVKTILENIDREKRESQIFSYRIKKKDGKYIWFQDKLNNKFDKTGKHIATYINSRDITNQVYYEETLQDSEERFREIFNNAHDAIYIHKIDDNGMPGKFIMANREALRRMDYTLKELKQMTPADIDTASKRENIPEIMKTLFENGENVFRGEHVTKSGKIIPVENRVHVFTLKNEKVIVSISRDISEELKAQERERQDKALLQSILDALPGKLRVINRDYQLIAANNALIEDITTEIHSTQDVIGQKCYDLFYSKNKPCEDCKMKAIESLNEPETKIYYKDENGIKDKKAFKLFLAPLRDEKNEKIGIIEYSVDITELKNAQRNAEKASRAKTEFMMNMSHELRTPLNGIIGFSGILEETGLNQTQKEFVRNIQVSGKLLLNVVSDILNYSKIETKKVALNIEETDLEQLLTTAYNGVRKMANNKGLDTQLSIDPAIPHPVLTDKIKLSQIFTNLLMNAVKFTEKGSVTCQAKLLDRTPRTADLLFTVTDTGIGIADEIKDKIFESFTQADSSLTRKYGGTGLGLTISSSLLQMMGSSIKLDSKPGKGSTFSFVITFQLPDDKKQDHPNEERANQISPKTEAKTFKILIVEDNFINLRLNRMILSRHFPEAEVITAEDGRKAVEEFIQHRPEIILMDIRMPNMDGFEATEQIRKIEGQNWKTTIIALSADARTENIQIGMLSGLDGYITKPVEPEELIEKIEEIIQK